MKPEDPNAILAQLHDIRLPEAPAPEPIWDIGLSLALLLISALIIAWTLLRNRRQKRNEATELLQTIDLTNPDNARAQMASVLRRVLHQHNPDLARCPPGNTYLQRLDQFFDTDFFTQGPGVQFGERLYQPVANDFQAQPVRDGLIALLGQLPRRARK